MARDFRGFSPLHHLLGRRADASSRLLLRFLFTHSAPEPTAKVRAQLGTPKTPPANPNKTPPANPNKTPPTTPPPLHASRHLARTLEPPRAGRASRAVRRGRSGAKRRGAWGGASQRWTVARRRSAAASACAPPDRPASGTDGPPQRDTRRAAPRALRRAG